MLFGCLIQDVDQLSIDNVDVDFQLLTFSDNISLVSFTWINWLNLFNINLKVEDNRLYIIFFVYEKIYNRLVLFVSFFELFLEMVEEEDVQMRNKKKERLNFLFSFGSGYYVRLQFVIINKMQLVLLFFVSKLKFKVVLLFKVLILGLFNM